MSRERLADYLPPWARKCLRVAAASSLLFSADSAPSSHLAALKVFTDPSAAVASELGAGQEQYTNEQVVARFVELLAKQDLVAIRRSLHLNVVFWKVAGENYGNATPKDAMINYFRNSFARYGVPQCLGWGSAGRNNRQIAVYFQNLNALGRTDLSKIAYVGIEYDPGKIDNSSYDTPWSIAEVDEVLNKDVKSLTANLEPCPQAQAQPKIVPTPTPAPRPTPTEARSLESQDTPLTREILARYVPLIEGMDLQAIAQNFHSKEVLTWDLSGRYRSYSDRPTRTQAQMLSLFQESFKARGAPRVVGYFWEMAYLGVLFENFGAPSISGSGYSFVGLISDASAKPPSYMRIYSIDELRAADVAQAKQQITLYKRQLPPSPTPIPEARELPKDLPAGKIVFIVSDEKNNGHVYVANSDGTDRQRLTEGTRIRRQVSWLDSQTLIYVLGGEGGGIVVYDLVTGEARQITRGSDWDPRPAGKGIVFSRLMGGPSQDLFYVDRDGGALRQITSDGIYNVEDHPAVSPDGKLIAYSSHTPGQHGRPSGAIIEDWGTLAQNFDPDRRPVFISGAVPIAWSPDSEKLFYVKFENIGQRSVGVGYLADKNGKIITRLVEGLAASGGSGSWTPDGKYIIASLQPRDGGNTQPYLIPVDGSSTIRLFGTQGFVSSIDWQPAAQVPAKKTEARRKVVLAAGLINEIKDGQLVGGAFDELIASLALQKKYDILRDVHLLSLGGWRLDGKRIILKDQDCRETLKGQDYGARLLLQFIQDLGQDEKYTFIGHSWGTIVILRALEIAQKEGIELNWQGMEVRLLHGPIQGQSKSGLAHLASIGAPDLPDGCKDILGTPSPAVGSYKTLVELLEMWDEKETRFNNIAALVQAQSKKGSDFIAFANDNDCVISASTCRMDELERELLMFKLLLRGRRPPILSQELPGGKTIWRSYPSLRVLGHREFLFSDAGLPVLLSTISPQHTSLD